jgi:uncharacterized protein YbjT (DUF2867 family)
MKSTETVCGKGYPFPFSYGSDKVKARIKRRGEKMKILIVGANGQIGQHLVKLLQEQEGVTPVAFVRKEEQVSAFEEKGVQARLGDLEGSVEDIQSQLKGMDAIVFTAGSGGSTGYDKTLLIDLDGAVKVMEAAKQEGIERFVMVSAMQANVRKNWNESIKPYYVAKHYADRLLEQSGLKYTIVRPGGLLNEKGTGKVDVSENNQGERRVIPREDVAKVVQHVLVNERMINQSFDLASGDTDIEEALNTL